MNIVFQSHQSVFMIKKHFDHKKYLLHVKSPLFASIKAIKIHEFKPSIRVKTYHRFRTVLVDVETEEEAR